jgi:tagaturonate reductase
MIQALKDQDCLYHVVLNGIQHGKTISETRLIKSVSSAINPYLNEPEFIKACENPDLQFVISNTTESGIEFTADDTRVDVLPSSFPEKLPNFYIIALHFIKVLMTKDFIFYHVNSLKKMAKT